MARTALLVPLVVFVAACAAEPIPVDEPEALARFADEQVAFLYPADWQRASFDMTANFSGLIVYLSTDPLADPCDRTPNSIECTRWPVERLSANGILVEWSHNAWPGWNFDPHGGRPLLVGGRRATAEELEPTDGCRALGGEKELRAIVPRGVAHNWTQVTACIRGPDTDQLTAQFGRMLTSVGWLSP